MTKDQFTEFLQIINSRKELAFDSWWDLHPRLLQFLANVEKASIGYYKNESANNCFYITFNRHNTVQIVLFDHEVEKEYWINLSNSDTNSRVEAFIAALIKK